MLASQLRTFLATARCLSFSAAAKELGVSQPYVSRQIKQLEEQSGSLLFDRLGRSIRLTGFGRDLMGIARQMIDAELEALELLTNAKFLQVGYLRIAAVGPYHLSGLLARFRQQYPQVNVSVSFGDSSRVQQAVVDMDADIGLLASNSHIPYCSQRTLQRCPIVLQIPHTHRFAGRKSVSIHALAGEHFIFREETSTTRRLFDALLIQHNVQVHSTLQLGSREAIRLAVASGLGMGYVSDAEADPHPRVRYLRIEESSAQTNATVVWRSGREKNGLTAAFLRAMDEAVDGA